MAHDTVYPITNHQELSYRTDTTAHTQYAFANPGIIFVDANVTSDGERCFETINAAIDYLNALTGADIPSESCPYLICLAPGIYNEKVWLPNFVSLEGSGVNTCEIIGVGASKSGICTLSVGIGDVRKIHLNPGGYDDGGQITAQLFIRDTLSVFSANEDDFTTVVDGMTLIVTPEGFPTETLTVAGVPSPVIASAADVVSWINSLAENFNAEKLFGRVAIRTNNASPINNHLEITLDKDGTLNPALGFKIDVDTYAQRSQLRSTHFDSLWIDGLIPYALCKAEYGVWCQTYDAGHDSDGGFWKIMQNCTVSNGWNGIICVAGELELKTVYIDFHGRHGIVADSGLIELDGAEALGNALVDVAGKDIVYDNGGQVRSRGSSYATIFRRGSGKLEPAGSRFMFEYIVSGSISISSFINGLKPIPYQCVIESISLVRRVAGSSGTTTVDILLGDSGAVPATIYAAPEDRPSINYVDGNNFVLIKHLPNTILGEGKFLSLDVVDAEVGAEDLCVQITMVVS